MSTTRRVRRLPLAADYRGAHARRVPVPDMTIAIALGLLLLAATLGGLVWLDRGPVGQHGRELKRPRRPADEDADQDAVLPPDASR